MTRFLLVSFFLATSSAASITRIAFDPPRPTSHTPVVVHVRGFEGGACTPRTQVTVSGSHIDVVALCGGGGIAVPMAWAADAYIGVLPAGTYDVVFNLTGEHRALVVEDAEGPFRLDPSEGASDAKSAIAILAEQPLTRVTFDGVAAERAPSAPNGAPAFYAPPHAPGAADVGVTFLDGTTYVAKNAFRYFDRNAFDPAMFEPLLVPVFFSGPGAYGASWVSELTMQDAAGNAAPLDLGQHPHGVLLHVPHDAAPRTSVSLRVRDVSRQAESFGTQIPVVRRDAFRGAPFTILDVPNDPRYRVLLRVYALEPYDTPLLAISAMDAQRPSFLPSLTMTKPAACCDEPAYGELDLTALLAGGEQPRYKITITPPFHTSEPLIWAFVTVTNNETQQVTVIAPQ